MSATPTSDDAGFTIIPNGLFALGNAHAIAVYAAIARHKGQDGTAWPSLKRLCDLTGLSRPTVSKAIDVLTEKRILVKANRSQNGAKQSNQYRLPDIEPTAKAMPATSDDSANVQMESTLPGYVSTFPRVGKEVSTGRQGDCHEVDPVELDPKELEPAAQATPYALLESMCQTLAQDVAILPKGEKSKQLAVAKRLVETGSTATDVAAITRWLGWMTGGIDLFTVEKYRGKWLLAGSPDGQPAQPDGSLRVLNRGQGGFDPLYTMPADEHADYMRRLEQAKADSETRERERQARAS